MSIGIYVVCVTCPTHLGLGDCVGLEPTAHTSDLVITKKTNERVVGCTQSVYSVVSTTKSSLQTYVKCLRISVKGLLKLLPNLRFIHIIHTTRVGALAHLDRARVTRVYVCTYTLVCSVYTQHTHIHEEHHTQSRHSSLSSSSFHSTLYTRSLQQPHI